MTWPDGTSDDLHLDGRCRDLLTDHDWTGWVITDECVNATASTDRTITSVTSTPECPALSALVGARAGGNLRRSLDEVVPDLKRAGRPSYLLLDDLAGASLIAGAVWLRWRDRLPDLTLAIQSRPPRTMEGICAGFRPGASSLKPDGTQSAVPHQIRAVPSIDDSTDPLSWHPLERDQGMATRRARRIDVWREADMIQVDAMFRDSLWEPDGSEIAVHEYQLVATAEAQGGTIVSLEAIPRVLPYDECPMAAANASWLIGAQLSELRHEVLRRLRLTDCCTHLNDALRALAEVPILAGAIAAAS